MTTKSSDFIQDSQGPSHSPSAQNKPYMLYPPLPASEETFIHQAVREMKADPDTINRMYEKFSQQIINDMQRKVNGTSRSRKNSVKTKADISPDPSFWGTVTSLPNTNRVTPLNVSPKYSLVTDTTEDKVGSLNKPENGGSDSKGWRAAKKISTKNKSCRRESTLSSNLFNLFVQSKRNDFRTTTVRERQLRGSNTNFTFPATHLNLQTSIVNERHDLNAARRAKTVFPFSSSKM